MTARGDLRREVPEPQRAPNVRSGDRLAVGAEGDVGRRSIVAEQSSEGLSGRGIVESGGPLPVTGEGEDASLGWNATLASTIIARTGVERDTPEGFGAGRFPESKDAPSLDRGEPSANRRCRDRHDEPAKAAGTDRLPPITLIPESDRFVPRAGGNPPTIGGDRHVVDEARMAGEHAAPDRPIEVPDPHGASLVSDGNELAVPTQMDRRRPPCGREASPGVHPSEVSQSRIAPSSEYVRSRRPSEANRTPTILARCPCKTARLDPVVVSQIRAVWSREPEANRRPSGLKSRLLIVFPWPFKAIVWPATVNGWIAMSVAGKCPPVAIREPSGLNAAACCVPSPGSRHRNGPAVDRAEEPHLAAEYAKDAQSIGAEVDAPCPAKSQPAAIGQIPEMGLGLLVAEQEP